MGAVRPPRFEQVVRRFYEAAAIPALWPQALQRLADACGARAATALPMTGPAPAAIISTPDVAHLIGQGIRSGWYDPARNSRMARCMTLVRRGQRGLITQQDAFSPDALARDPFEQEFIRPNGFSTFAGAVLTQAPGLAPVISLERARGQDLFMNDEIKEINRLLAHLRAAGDLAVRIGMTTTQRVSDALAAAGHPVALLARDGMVVHLNAQFERLIGDGVQVRAGRLSSWQSDADRALTVAVSRAIAFEGTDREPIGPVVLPRPHGLRPLVAQVVPVVGQAHDALHLVVAVVTLIDLEASQSGPPEIMLEQAFGLTPAEARLASQLAAGKTLPEITRTEGSARETLRSRLKSIFAKTGTSRQAELTALLSRLRGL